MSDEPFADVDAHVELPLLQDGVQAFIIETEVTPPPQQRRALSVAMGASLLVDDVAGATGQLLQLNPLSFSSRHYEVAT